MVKRNRALCNLLFLAMMAVCFAHAFAQDPGTKDYADGPSPKALRNPPTPRKPDFNQDIYYKHKLEFSLETGWHPINIPFVYNFITGDTYTKWPLSYTLVPNIASIRWHFDGIDGPSIVRGNTDLSFSGTYTAVVRGPETRYFAFDFGIRRNFIPRRWRVAPYFDMRGGVGNINAKGPNGVVYAQGEDLTFTYMMGAGARLNFSPRFSIAGGLNYMHVSNASLSAPKVHNYGINVYGPMVGIYTRVGKPRASFAAH